MRYFKIYDLSDQPEKNNEILRDFCRIFVLQFEHDVDDFRLMKIMEPEDEQYAQVVTDALLLLSHLYCLECKIFGRLSFEDAIKKIKR